MIDPIMENLCRSDIISIPCFITASVTVHTTFYDFVTGYSSALDVLKCV